MTVMAGSSGDSGVQVAARHYETRFVASQTGNARAEVQDLVFDSVVQAEVQVSAAFTGHCCTGWTGTSLQLANRKHQDVCWFAVRALQS